MTEQGQPTEVLRVWFQAEAEARKYVAIDPTGLHPHLMMLLAMSGLPESSRLSAFDSVRRGRYAIGPAMNHGEAGFELVVYR